MKKRIYGVLGLLLALLGAACVSLARISTGEEYVAAAGAQSLYRLDVAGRAPSMTGTCPL